MTQPGRGSHGPFVESIASNVLGGSAVTRKTFAGVALLPFFFPCPKKSLGDIWLFMRGGQKSLAPLFAVPRERTRGVDFTDQSRSAPVLYSHPYSFVSQERDGPTPTGAAAWFGP